MTPARPSWTLHEVRPVHYGNRQAPLPQREDAAGFPGRYARLEHIFAKQVYGLAPTEIIYRIAISYILGFAKDHGITAHHIRQADTLEFAKAGTMERELDKIFRD